MALGAAADLQVQRCRDYQAWKPPAMLLGHGPRPRLPLSSQVRLTAEPR
jgi:hypothetical protein